MFYFLFDALLRAFDDFLRPFDASRVSHHPHASTVIASHPFRGMEEETGELFVQTFLFNFPPSYPLR